MSATTSTEKRILKAFIHGTWIPAEPSLPNINPSDTSDVVAWYANTAKGDVDDAIRSARTSFASWSASNIQQRANILHEAAAGLIRHRQSISETLSREEGKPLRESAAEVARAADIFRFYAGEALRLAGENLPSIRENVEVDIYREPVGVVAVITPWNIPLGIPAWKLAPAIAYGNTVVFKPSEFTPSTAVALVEVLQEAGLPDGVVNLVPGDGRSVGSVLLESPDVDAVSFTGSAATGAVVRERAAASGKKVQLEMGGKNPLVVMADCDLDHAVACAADGAFFATGQRCTASSRLLVHESVREAFTTRLTQRMRNLKVGHALDERTELGPVANDAQFKKILEFLEIGQQEGAELVDGNVRKLATDGYYLEPGLFVHSRNDMRINQEEIFGPVAAVIPFGEYEEALALANDTRYGLSASICTSSLKYATDFRRRASAGMIMVNLPTAGVDYHVPFGGYNASSYGPREQGRYAVDFYTKVKTSYCLAL